MQHHGYLLLAGGTVAGDGHFYLPGLVFGDGNFAVESGDHRHALRPTQLEHRLDVLAVERCLDGHLVGQILVDDAAHALIDVAQAHVMVLHAVEPQHTHDDEFRFLAVHPQQGISHNISARVDADDDILILFVQLILSC